MVVAPREVGRAHDHQPTDVAIRRDIAHLREAARTEETFALHLRMAHAERRWGGIREPHREAHDHQVRRRAAACACHRALRGGRNELKQEVFEVPLVHRDTELTCCRAYSQPFVRGHQSE